MNQSRLLHCSLVAMVVAVCSAVDCSGPACKPGCSDTVRVDPSGPDCSAKVAAGESILNSSCTSLQDVLEALATLTGYGGERCVAIELAAGLHTVTRTVAIGQSVMVVGEERQPTTSSSPPSQPPQEVSAACHVLETTNLHVHYNYVEYWVERRGCLCPSQFLGCMHGYTCSCQAFRFRKLLWPLPSL